MGMECWRKDTVDVSKEASVGNKRGNGKACRCFDRKTAGKRQGLYTGFPWIFYENLTEGIAEIWIWDR